MRAAGVLVASLAMSIAAERSIAAIDIYFTTGPVSPWNGVYHSVVGSNAATLFHSTPGEQGAIGVAASGSNVFWATHDPGGVWRKPSSGGPATQLLAETAGSTRQVQIHNGQVLWNSEHSGIIWTANTDGSNRSVIWDGPSEVENGVWDFAFAGGRIYWASWSSTWVRSVALDGTDLQQFRLPGNPRVFSIDADENGLLLGVHNQGPNAGGGVWRTDLTGATRTQIASVIDNVECVDLFDGRAYWGYSLGGAGPRAIVESSDLQGVGRRTEMDVSNVAPLFQFTIVPAPSAAAPFVAFALALRGRPRRPGRT